MGDIKIEKTNRDLGVRIETDKYGSEIYVTRNGWQWNGQAVTPELAKLMIEVLEEYLKG